jgi:hypothetical protein
MVRISLVIQLKLCTHAKREQVLYNNPTIREYYHALLRVKTSNRSKNQLACVFGVWLLFNYAMEKDVLSTIRQYFGLVVPLFRRRRYRKRSRGREWEV